MQVSVLLNDQATVLLADITRPVNTISVGQHVLLLIEVDDLPPLHKLLIKKCVAAGGGVQIILIEDFKPNPLLSSLVQYQPSNLLTSKTTYVELRTFQIPNTPTGKTQVEKIQSKISVNFDCDISIVPE